MPSIPSTARRPYTTTILINTYRQAADLYVDGTTLSSQEGTMQGDPLAMPMYTIALLPLIRQCNQEVKQVWYADDATAAGRVSNLRSWWDKLIEIGPAYGFSRQRIQNLVDSKGTPSLGGHPGKHYHQVRLV